MKTTIYTLIIALLAVSVTSKVFAGNAKLTTSSMAADTIYQGTSSNNQGVNICFHILFVLCDFLGV